MYTWIHIHILIRMLVVGILHIVYSRKHQWQNNWRYYGVIPFLIHGGTHSFFGKFVSGLQVAMGREVGLFNHMDIGRESMDNEEVIVNNDKYLRLVNIGYLSWHIYFNHLSSSKSCISLMVFHTIICFLVTMDIPWGLLFYSKEYKFGLLIAII